MFVFKAGRVRLAFRFYRFEKYGFVRIGTWYGDFVCFWKSFFLRGNFGGWSDVFRLRAFFASGVIC